MVTQFLAAKGFNNIPNNVVAMFTFCPSFFFFSAYLIILFRWYVNDANSINNTNNNNIFILYLGHKYTITPMICLL